MTFDPIAFAMNEGGTKFENSIGNSKFNLTGTHPEILHVDSFYVRLQGNYMYFTETALDTIVLAAIQIKDYKDSSTLSMPNCI